MNVALTLSFKLISFFTFMYIYICTGICCVCAWQTLQCRGARGTQGLAQPRCLEIISQRETVATFVSFTEQAQSLCSFYTFLSLKYLAREWGDRCFSAGRSKIL